MRSNRSSLLRPVLIADRALPKSRPVELATKGSSRRSSLASFGRTRQPSIVLDEPTDDDWIGKLRSAVADHERVGSDMVRVLAGRSALHRHLPEVLDLWSEALERAPRMAIAIGQALPHILDAVAQRESERPQAVKLFGQSLGRAHDLDLRAEKRGAPTELGRLTQALLAADMSIPSAHPSVIAIIRSHSAILSTDAVTWPYFAPYA
jgi:hypothetical protein